MKYLTPVGSAAGNESEKMLEQMLIVFMKGSQEKCKEITQAIEAGDVAAAHRLAHALRNNAAMVGKARLESAAADVERQLEGGENLLTDTAMRMLETELHAVLEEFLPLLKECAISSGVSQNKEEAYALLEKLEALIQSRSSESIAFLDEINHIPGSMALARSIEAFDFESAEAALAELKSTLEREYEA
jgi:HPt (histidine-containing phosphotransfer) domain-containing protein